MPPCEMQISPSPLKCNKINSSSSSRKSTILFLTVLQNLSMYLLLLSTGSELSDPNYISHFTDVQSFPPKIDMEELLPHKHTNSFPTPPPNNWHWAYVMNVSFTKVLRMKVSYITARQTIYNGISCLKSHLLTLPERNFRERVQKGGSMFCNINLKDLSIRVNL